jgi:hypothetical protein
VAHQEQVEQQASNPPIPINERMDLLKSSMEYRQRLQCMHAFRNIRACCFNPVVEQDRYLRKGRRAQATLERMYVVEPEASGSLAWK